MVRTPVTANSNASVPPEKRVAINCPVKACGRHIVWINQNKRLQAPKGTGCIVCVTPAQFLKYVNVLDSFRYKCGSYLKTITRIEGLIEGREWTRDDVLLKKKRRIKAHEETTEVGAQRDTEESNEEHNNAKAD